MITIKWVPLVNNYNLCCCSCTLRTGTLIIAWLGLMGQIIQTMDSASRLYFYKEDLEDTNRNLIALTIVEENLKHSNIEEENVENRLQDEETLDQEVDNLGNTDEMNQGGDNFGEVIQNEGISNGGDLATEITPEESDDTSEDLDTTYFYSPVSREALVTRLFFGLLLLVVHVSLLYGAWTEKPQFMVPYVLVQFFVVVLIILLIIILFFINLFTNALQALELFAIGGPISVLVAYLWAAVYTYYRQLAELSLPQKDTQLQNLTYVKSEEEEAIINPEEIQKAYSQIEYNIQQNQPHAV